MAELEKSLEERQVIALESIAQTLRAMKDQIVAVRDATQRIANKR